MYLYEKIDVIRESGNLLDEIPNYIKENLNRKMKLRPYQVKAFSNYFYYDSSNLKTVPSQTLFHMATGSGKTLIMAGLILYLYKKGYRNFLFFVNSTTIINKTKVNFLDKGSSKYLFNNEINIDGQKVMIREVNTFQESNADDINICFSTIQGLHSSILMPKENSLTVDDFSKNKIVLISDEAHHINVMTARGRVDRDEQELLNNWEYTVEKIFHSNIDNVLLEFTATCDVDNELISAKYIDKMIFNYPLSKFREEGYSKEVETLQSNADLKTKMIQAVLLSQYRLKIFQDNKIDVKPVILFKSNTITNSKENMRLFIDTISNLTSDDILSIKENSSNEILINMFSYFEETNVNIPNLIIELKDDFSKEKCISVNDDSEALDTQLIVNSLEDKDNYYRAVFEVEKLDEGWDVLNLYDIVRLYETRDGDNGRPGKKTIREAQLIGRGARYYPFKIGDYQEMYLRKYDNDIGNPLRICETLLYHCQMEPRYISELKIALKENGIIPSEVKKINYIIKDSFKKTEFYKNGLVFYNHRVLKDRSKVDSVSESIRYSTFNYNFDSDKSKIENLFEEKIDFKNITEKLSEKIYTIKELCSINYNLVYSAFKNFNVFDFNILKSHFPQLISTRQFLSDEKYLGNIKISISSIYKEPSIDLVYKALVKTFNKIKDDVITFDESYEGSLEFCSKQFNEVFKDKICNITNPDNDSVGISQNMVTDESYKLDLSDKEWFVYNDNYGTTEEKKFVKFFYEHFSSIKEKFDHIYLVRNERELPIYSFTSGERFEPDYLLFIIDNDNLKQYQIFIEPKGSHLLEKDKWKEDFLKSLYEHAIPTTKFVENTEYLIWGFPFYNSQLRNEEFTKEFNKLVEL